MGAPSPLPDIEDAQPPAAGLDVARRSLAPLRLGRFPRAGSGATNPATKASTISLSGTLGGAETASSAPIGNMPCFGAAMMRRNVPGSLASKHVW